MSENESKYIPEAEEKIVSLDIDKLINTFLKLLPWLSILLIGALVISYIYLRYTKPVYESSSVLKLDIKNEVSVLGLIPQDEDQNVKTISSEIELLKSRLFFSKIIKELNLGVTVYTIGQVLVDERYKSAPFDVQYQIKNAAIYDVPIYVEIINAKTYRINFTVGGRSVSGKYNFGETVDNDFLRFRLTTTAFYHPGYEDVKLFFLINSEQALENYLGNNLNVQPINLNANTIEISFKDNNQFKARDLVNAIDTIYLNYTKAEKSKANNQKIEFIDEQLKTTESKLNEFEDYFENFTIQNKTTDLDNTLNKSIGLLNSIDSDQYYLRRKLTRLNEIRDSLESGKAVAITLEDQQLLPGSLQQEIKEINDLKQKKYILAQSYNPNTQAYQKLEGESDFLTGNLKKSLDEYISNLRDQQTYLHDQHNYYENKFLSIPSKNTEYGKIQRYYKLYEDFYLSLMQKKAEFQLALAGTVTDFKILSPAYLPQKPLSPDRWMVYGISLVAWFIFSFFLVGFLYLINNKINSQEEMERLTTLPILGSIPFYTMEKLKESKLIIDKNSRSAISEAFRALRTNLQFLKTKNKNLIISLSSTVSGEGKTFIAINIAAVLALSQKKVILVDLDMRKPKIHSIFNTDNTHGVSTVLSGQDKIENCIIPSGVMNCDILVAGPVPPNPSELILSEEFDYLLNYLSSQYDMVILDTPPVGLVTDGVLVMKKSDVQLFILREGVSNRKFLEGFEKLNHIHGFSNLAFVLNAIKISRRSHYGSGYGYGYGYYAEKKKKPWFKLKK